MAPSPVRVLHLIKGLGPGGAERLLAGLATAADKERFEYHVAYLLDWKSHLASDIEGAGVVVSCLGVASERDLRWVRTLRQLLHRLQPDVVHVHSPLLAAGVRAVRLTLRRSRRPVVVSTEHNTWKAFSLPTRLANGLTYPLDARHFAVSEEARSSIWRAWRRSTEVVVHGVDLSGVRARIVDRDRVRVDLDLASDDVAVTTVANYRVHKDYPNLLAAAAEVLDRCPKAVFLVIGQGPLENSVTAEVHRLGLESRVRLLGYRPDAIDILAASDVFTLSSIQEGMPVALMEALALGLPVVSTAVGGIPDAISDGVEGFLVAPRRPDALAEAIVRLVDDAGLRRRLGAAASARSASFDVRRSTRYFERAYSDLRGRVRPASEQLDVTEGELELPK